MAGRLRRAALVVAAMGSMSACEPNRYVSGWIPWWGATDGRATVANATAASVLGEVSLFWFGTRADGTIGVNGNSSGLAATVGVIRDAGLPVVPTIADGTGKGVMLGILSNPVSRAGHVANIVNLVAASGYDGIDLDYEVFAFSHPSSEWPSITPYWVAFINEVGAALHARGKVLSVTVPPVWESGGRTRGYTVYAQEQIAAAVDRLRLMVYDWSPSTPSPNAPFTWVQEVIAWSSARVPVEKLQLGVPAYGRHWAKQAVPTETCPDGALFTDGIEMGEVAPLAAEHGLTPTRDASGELTFAWTEVVSGPKIAPVSPPGFVPPPTTVSPAAGSPGVPQAGSLQPAYRLSPFAQVTCTVQHIVFAPDALTVRQRADAAVAAGWSGITIWALGYETPDTYDPLAGVAPQRPNGDPTGALDAPTVVGNRVTVSGWAVDPEFDLPVPVRVAVSGAGSTSTTQTARTERVGMANGLGRFHGISVQFTLPSGSYTVCATLLGWGANTGPSLGCRTFTVSGGV